MLSENLRAVSGFIRVFQIFFAFFTIAISISFLDSSQVHASETDGLPIEKGAHREANYTIVVGIFSLFDGIMGMVSVLMVFLLSQSLVLACDTVTTLVNLAFGVGLLVILKCGNCTDGAYLESNSMINPIIQGTIVDPVAELNSRCHEAQAITVMIFGVCLTCGGTLWIGLTDRIRNR